MIRQETDKNNDVWIREGVGPGAVRVVWNGDWPIVEVASRRDALGDWCWDHTEDSLLVAQAIGAATVARLETPPAHTLKGAEWARAAARRGPGATTGFNPPTDRPAAAVCDGGCGETLTIHGDNADAWLATCGWVKNGDKTICGFCNRGEDDAADPIDDV